MSTVLLHSIYQRQLQSMLIEEVLNLTVGTMYIGKHCNIKTNVMQLILTSSPAGLISPWLC